MAEDNAGHFAGEKNLPEGKFNGDVKNLKALASDIVAALEIAVEEHVQDPSRTLADANAGERYCMVAAHGSSLGAVIRQHHPELLAQTPRADRTVAES